MESSFRGRKFLGIDINIPEDYQGLIYTVDNGNNTLKSESKFNAFTLWGHDVEPSRSSNNFNVEHWIKISDIINKT
jgi:hypothetical protein